MNRRPTSSQFQVELPRGEVLLISRVTCQPPAGMERLSRSERDVIDLVLEGCSNAEIAVRRRTSVHTVANQLKAVFRKLGCSGRSELVALLAAAEQPEAS